MATVDVPERILVCGSRDWDDERIIRQILLALRDPWNDKQTVIHGDARGADTQGAEVARELGYRIKSFPAKWDEHGRSAGPRRNKQMLVEGKPDIVYAFTSKLPITTGTANMVRQSKRAGLPVYVISRG